MGKKAAVLVLAGALVCLAIAFWAGMAAGQEEQVSPTIAEILQQRVSLRVENATAMQLTDAVLRLCGETTAKMGGNTFTLVGGPGPGGPPLGDTKWRITLSVNNVRLGDLLRAVAALGESDVYIKSPTEVVICWPELREERGVKDIRPLTAEAY